MPVFPLRGHRIRHLSHTAGIGFCFFEGIAPSDTSFEMVSASCRYEPTSTCYPVASFPFGVQNTTRRNPFYPAKASRVSLWTLSRIAPRQDPRNWQTPLAARPRTLCLPLGRPLRVGSHFRWLAATRTFGHGLLSSLDTAGRTIRSRWKASSLPASSLKRT